MVSKKKTAIDLEMKICNESLSRGKIYLAKNRKGQPCHTN